MCSILTPCSWVLLKDIYRWIWRESERSRKKIMFQNFINGRKLRWRKGCGAIFLSQFSLKLINWMDLKVKWGKGKLLSFFFYFLFSHNLEKQKLNFFFFYFLQTHKQRIFFLKIFPCISINNFLPFVLFNF